MGIALRSSLFAVAAALASTSGHAVAAATTTESTDAASSDTADAEQGGEIVVFGRGETRQVQELGGSQIQILAPGTSPLKAIEKLPSVNFQSADPFGNYEWSQRVSIRSFNQNQLGFTLDGIPLGDASYGNNNGLHISRAISSENIASVRVSQGSGSLGTQATNNLGGTIETFSRDPDPFVGLDANGTYGSDDTYRGFARLNLGRENGLSGYVSYAFAETGKWKGEGVQRQNAVNAKAVLPIGDVKLSATFAFSHRAEQDYHDFSQDMIARLGFASDNFGRSQYALAIRVGDIAANRGDTGTSPQNPAAGTTYPAPIASADDAYYDAAGIRRDILTSVGLTVPVAASGQFALRGYAHTNRGQGLWGTPYLNSPSGVPLSLRTTEYDIDRKGAFARLDLPVAGTDLAVGAWFENNDFNQARRFYGFVSRTDPGRSFTGFQSGPFFTQWEFAYNTQTLQYFVSDRVTLGDLVVNLGWKGFKVDNEATPIIQAGRARGEISVQDWFQPHIGFALGLGDRLEAFGGFTQATRAFTAAFTGGPFATTQAGFDAIKDDLKPETSDTFEIGLRANGRRFNGTLGAYYVNFQNRLLALTTGAAIVGNPPVLQNVGSVRSFGFEAAGDLRLGGGFGLYASYSYTDSTYRSDVVNAQNVVTAATRGKTVVDTPRHLLRGEISFDNDQIFGRVGANYMSRRFFTYENTNAVDGRVLVDATAGVRINDRVEVQLNATNLLNKKYVATIGSNGFGSRGDNQTLLIGAPQQFFATLKLRVGGQ